MMVNQTADTLKNNELETNFISCVGIATQIPYPILSIPISLGFLQRFGLLNNKEIQIKNRLEVWPYITYYGCLPYISNNIDLNFKFRLFDKNNVQLAVLPGFGIYGGWNFYGFSPIYGKYGTGIAGIDLDFIFIGSYVLKNNNDISFFYSMSLGLKKNFFNLGSQLFSFFHDSSDNYIDYYIEAFDLDFGTSIGWEIRNKYILRHEVCIGFTAMFYHIISKEIDYSPMYFRLNYFNLYLSYGFSLGRKYNL